MIEINKNNHMDVWFHIKKQDNTDLDLTDGEVRFVVKTKKGEGRKIIEKSSNNGDITLENPAGGMCIVHLVPEDTENITPKTYVFEVSALVPDGADTKRYTAVVDEFKVLDIVDMSPMN